ncbi:MAG: hypothetical protein A3J85_04625 [Desulfobacula sp. RIFOXYA12_FULL_46_16]|nr:MAG: hypothetical protein A2464_11420 [Deltaproteobacteria bacterium RIFOXYC2_FULL_48_10]OGR20756.1 MAG: hypothetical protein A3J85_04625 [Desulfobacula sp. RIFOXYA12_FULL_46_16]
MVALVKKQVPELQFFFESSSNDVHQYESYTTALQSIQYSFVILFASGFREWKMPSGYPFLRNDILIDKIKVPILQFPR